MSGTTKNPRLGKGLAALMGESQAELVKPGDPVRDLDLDLLEPNPFQPRMDMPEEALSELADSIRAQGILQPILVRPHPSVEGRYQIVAGERRWRAAALAGLHQVPVYVRQLPDISAAAAALVENLQRQDLNPIEEAEGLKRLIDDFEFTHDAMGEALGKSRPHITNTLRLLQLPPEVQLHVRDGSLSAGHARTLLSHPDPKAAMERVIARGMSVRQTERLVQTALSREPRRSRRSADPNVRALETDLSDALGLRVRLSVNADGAGQVVITVDNWLQIEDLKERLTVA